MSVSVSVVIPTYNRTRLLRQTIPALASQASEGRPYEVIFVSNGSTDDTPAVLEEAARSSPDVFRWTQIAPTGGPSAPRNVGIRMARGAVVVILDDDVVPEPGLVAAHARYHEANPGPECCGLGEAYVPEELLTDPVSVFHVYPYHEVRHGGPLSHQHFWTCNVSFKRDFMLRHGMFDESLLYYEDVEVARRLHDAGMRLRFVPEARGLHLHQMKADGIAAKGEFIGRWLHVFEQRYPEVEIRRRHGVLHPSIGPVRFALRAVNRVGLHALASPPAMALLRGVGATRGQRSRLSDLYLYTLFRSNMLRGYHEAAREARRRGDGAAAARTTDAWINRGEPEPDAQPQGDAAAGRAPHA